VEVRESPDDRVYVEHDRSVFAKDITTVCHAMAPVDSYEEWRHHLVDLLKRSMAREGGRVKRLTLLWPKHWAGLTPRGIDKQGPTWEDAECLG
jgi:hypothetical protein